MKYITIIIASFFLSNLSAQSMKWIELKKEEHCVDHRDKENNIYCLGLEYTPAATGILSSYTTGFFINCTDGNSPITFNQSCLLKDNSQILNGCEEAGKILLNASANSGEVGKNKIEKGIPIVLHQVCFEVLDKATIDIQKDDVTGVTTAIITDDNNQLQSEFPRYEVFEGYPKK